MLCNVQQKKICQKSSNDAHEHVYNYIQVCFFLKNVPTLVYQIRVLVGISVLVETHCYFTRLNLTKMGSL